jgi:acyl dehydratase
VTTAKLDNGHLALDDLFVGQHFISDGYFVRAAEIRAFAQAFVPQPFHVEDSESKGTVFGGLVASGWHTAALTMRLNVDGGLPIAGGIIGAGGELTWPAPLRAGDVIHVESQITEIVPSRSRSDRAIVTAVSRTINQRGEIVQILKAKLVVFRRAALPAPTVVAA